MDPLGGTSFYIGLYREIYVNLFFLWTNNPNVKEFHMQHPLVMACKIAHTNKVHFKMASYCIVDIGLYRGVHLKLFFSWTSDPNTKTFNMQYPVDMVKFACKYKICPKMAPLGDTSICIGLYMYMYREIHLKFSFSKNHWIEFNQIW